MSWNTPDDWNAHWRKCPDCGAKWHAADGGHDCPDDEPEPEDVPEPPSDPRYDGPEGPSEW